MQVREQAERIADALDRASLSEADQAANNALKATDEAKIVADRQLDLFWKPIEAGRRNCTGSRAAGAFAASCLAAEHERL